MDRISSDRGLARTRNPERKVSDEEPEPLGRARPRSWAHATSWGLAAGDAIFRIIAGSAALFGLRGRFKTHLRGPRQKDTDRGKEPANLSKVIHENVQRETR
jgi:hypothetical protein